MSVWTKLFTALRGNINHAAEAAADSQALTILDEEMRQTKGEIRKSEQALTTIVAKEKLAQGKIADLNAAIAEHEHYAVQAMEKGDEALALEVAEKIAEFETQLETEKQFLDQVSASVAQLRKDLKDSKNNLRLMQQQVDTVKATASVQKAQESLSSRHLSANSKMKTASESLERIKKNQAQRGAEIEAARDMASAEDGSDLKARLKSAGITGNSGGASDILARLKAKQQSS
ncbi:PspA/IM30 family protein [Marinobacterium aestuariivivens]|uniref:PspA/IM30 family protein n=1 Tax=Marinobacterium aestuariivivens TaxID=1698799 RepID=A0ABW2A0U7_9GAMM